MFDNDEIHFTQTILTKIPGLKIGILKALGCDVSKKSEFVSQQFIDLESFIKDKFSDKAPSSDSIVSAVRRMYRRIGWEPTQYRPSSEAMIRRFLKEKGLYRINNIVDLGNVASTRFHLPMGLYDLDKISGSISVDVGQKGEEYRGISKEVIHATGKLVLRDKKGVFGNPTADSLRTSVQLGTKKVLALFFTPPEVDQSYLMETLTFLKDLYIKDCPEISVGIDVIIS